MPLYRGPPPGGSGSSDSTRGSGRRQSQHQQGLLYRALRRIKRCRWVEGGRLDIGGRFLKATYGILLTCLSATGDALDAALEHLGILMVELVKAIAWPFKWIFPTPEIIRTFKGRPLAMVLPIIFVCNIIMLLYIIYVFCVMPLLGVSLSSFSSIGFHLCSLLAMVSYYKAVVIDPGKIPEDLWSAPSPAGAPPPHLYERKGKDGSIRYCNKEHKFKPDRAHFCSPMGRNVLRMDHYCPWLANSVGFYNHKYFFLFLLYVVIACNTVTCQIIHALVHLASAGGYAAQPGQLLFLLEGLSISALLSTIVTPFFAFHTWLISTNVTTVEYCEKRRDVGGGSGPEGLSKNIVSRMPDRSPYDVGLIKNWQSVMGRNFLTWLLPTGPRGIGDGLAFPINSQAKDVLEKELGITVTLVDGGDLEAGRRRSRRGGGGGGRVGLASDDEEEDSNAEIRKALEYRQQQLAEAVEEPEAPPSPASEGSSSSTAASYPAGACCSGAAGGGSLVEYGLEKSNELADFITDLYMSGWKILAGPRRGGKKRRGQQPAATTP
ncbi:Palmitoyltransferase zdhhc15, partial [Perkinsus olseni]